MSRYWTLNDIDWNAFEPAKVDPELLATVKAAALVEANAPDYVAYLRNVFAGEAPLCEALHEWGAEEEQHGAALAAWAKLADPTFDFEDALARVRTEGYKLPLDTTESVRGSHTGELFARCIVESGTTSFYSAMHDDTDEPVLKQITHNIAADEVRHYKLFRRYLADYERRDIPLGKLGRLKILAQRVAETSDDEFAYAYYASNLAPRGDVPYDRDRCSVAYEKKAYGVYRREHLEKGAKMMLKVIGFDTDSLFVKAAMPVAWFLMRRKQRGLEKRALAVA